MCVCVCVYSVGKVTACRPADGCCDPVILCCQSCRCTDGWTGGECTGEWMSACWLFFFFVIVVVVPLFLNVFFFTLSPTHFSLHVVSELWVNFRSIKLISRSDQTLWLSQDLDETWEMCKNLNPNQTKHQVISLHSYSIEVVLWGKVAQLH